MTINVGIYRIKIFMYPTITIMLLFHFVGGHTCAVWS